jgi:hypothetical protein
MPKFQTTPSHRRRLVRELHGFAQHVVRERRVDDALDLPSFSSVGTRAKAAGFIP